MQQVLQAERDAERAIHECENEAQRIINDASVHAQTIHARTDQRITNMEMRHSHKIDKMIKTIEREGAVELRLDAEHHVDPDSLLAVIRQLAVELCQSGAAGDETGSDQ